MSAKPYNFMIVTYRLHILLLITIYSCQNPEKNQTVGNTNTTEVEADMIIAKTSIADSLIQDFILHTENKLIQFSLKDSSLIWIFDDVIITDTASYTTYRLGHDITDDNGTSLRFATDAWVYIDTVKRRLYEYDTMGDSLIVN